MSIYAINSFAQKGGQELGSILPYTLPAHEQKIDQSAPDAKLRQHFRGFTKKVIPLATPSPSPTPTLYLPCIFRKPRARLITPLTIMVIQG